MQQEKHNISQASNGTQPYSTSSNSIRTLPSIRELLDKAEEYAHTFAGSNNNAYTMQCVIDEHIPRMKFLEYRNLKKDAERYFKYRIRIPFIGAILAIAAIMLLVIFPTAIAPFLEMYKDELLWIVLMAAVVPLVLIMWTLYIRSVKIKFMNALHAIGKQRNFEPQDSNVFTIPHEPTGVFFDD